MYLKSRLQSYPAFPPHTPFKHGLGSGEMGFFAERLRRNQKAKAASSHLTTQIRSAQWEYWHRNEDLWACTDALLREYTAGFAKRPGSMLLALLMQEPRSSTEAVTAIRRKVYPLAVRKTCPCRYAAQPPAQPQFSSSSLSHVLHVRS